LNQQLRLTIFLIQVDALLKPRANNGEIYKKYSKRLLSAKGFPPACSRQVSTGMNDHGLAYDPIPISSDT